VGCLRTDLERGGLCFGRENEGILSTGQVGALMPHKEGIRRPYLDNAYCRKRWRIFSAVAILKSKGGWKS
jgi:hypothetical protein